MIAKTPPIEEGIQSYKTTEDSEIYKREERIDETVSQNKPSFVKPLTILNEVTEGGAVTFEAQVTPINDPTLRIEWYLNGKPLASGQLRMDS